MATYTRGRSLLINRTLFDLVHAMAESQERSIADVTRTLLVEGLDAPWELLTPSEPPYDMEVSMLLDIQTVTEVRDTASITSLSESEVIRRAIAHALTA